jgi:hypothetical protein
LSWVNPKLSAYAYLNGNFDFNKMPLSPPGTKVLVYLKPDQQASWAYHGEEGWYVGPSLVNYCCVKCYMPATARVRNVNTLQFFPTKNWILSTSTEDYLKKSAIDIIALLQNLPTTLPYLQYGNTTKNSLIYIVFNNLYNKDGSKETME